MDGELKDAYLIFTDTLSKLMDELNITPDRFTKQELKDIMKLASSKYEECWTDMMSYVLYGENKKSLTIQLLKIINRSKWRSYTK